MRKGFTHRRLHRCHACGWRGWGTVTVSPARAESAAARTRPAPDLEAIDVAVERSGDRPRG
jgi:hypothetical protein